MTEENKRGSIRAKPDPMALATKGRVTTHESLDIAGVPTKVRANSGRVTCRTR